MMPPLMQALISHLPRMGRCSQGLLRPVWRRVGQGLRHDLRSPPAALLSLAGLYRAGAIDGDQLAAQAAVHAREALMLIDELACLADEPFHPYRIAVLDLAEVVAGAMDEAWPAAREAGVALQRMTCPERLWIRGDHGMLSRLLGCMLRRAIALLPKGETIRLGLGAASTRYCVDLSFTGDVPSVLAEAMAPATTLGLLAARVAERHGGTAATLAGNGSPAWRLVLPRAAPKSEKAPEGAFSRFDP